MLPDSWKREIKEAVEETANADREQRQAKTREGATEIATAINALSQAQNTQTDHEDRHEKINVALAVITIFLVFLTVIFTGLSWWAFHGQLEEMKSASIQTNQIIKANADLAKAATKQADAADKQATALSENAA